MNWPRPTPTQADLNNPGGYLIGNLIRCRPDQQGPMFRDAGDGRVVARLSGYAIVPLEEWEKLGGKLV